MSIFILTLFRPLRFRNYNPKDSELQSQIVEPAPIGPSAKDKISTVEGEVEEFERNAAKELPAVDEELDLADLAPKKPNWDLKRDLEAKLEKLEEATLSAISELVRERLQSQKDISAAASVSF